MIIKHEQLDNIQYTEQAIARRKSQQVAFYTF